MNRETIWTVAKIVGVAAVAALLMKYEQNNPETEATARGSLAKGALMWTLGFAIATVGGIAVIGTLGGAAAIFGALGLAVAVISLIMGSGDEARDRAEAAYESRFASDDAGRSVSDSDSTPEPESWTDYNGQDERAVVAGGGKRD